MQRWQTIVLCVVLGGAGACNSAATERQIRDDAGQAPDGDSGFSEPDSGAGEPDSGFPQPNPDSGWIDPGPGEEPGPGECGASTFEAEKIVVQREVQVESQVTVVKPVALYVLFDKSRSMGPNNAEYAGKELWDPAVAAMKAFVNDEKSKDIGIGIQYFPKSGGSCSNGNGYKSPAVNVGSLPAHAANIAASLDAENPTGVGGLLNSFGGTPIEGALRGATDFCKQYQTDHADEQCVAVIVTDGKPEYADGCEENHNDLAAIAAGAKTAGVTTFAVGLQGADFSLLDKIAMAGGAPDCEPTTSTHACNVSSGPNKLSEALTKIRDTVVKTETKTVIETFVEETTLPCEWMIPEQPAGKIFDPNKVNIRLTTTDAETTFVRVPNRAACQGNAWHFDTTETPTRLIACPQACENIESTQGKIEVLLGCQTLTPI